MKINFIWNGHYLEASQKQDAEKAFTKAIADRFHENLTPPLSVHLFHDIANSTITGAVVDQSEKQVLKITRSLSARNHTKTTYELIGAG